jgi:histidinol-phosphate aminotransferase
MKFNPLLESVKSYEAGKPTELLYREYNLKPSDIIKLASNENPLGASKKVIEAVSKYANLVSIYPDDSYYDLKQALAKKHKVNNEEIIIGNGSDQIIEFCIRSIDPKNANILTAKTTFSMYKIYANISGIRVRTTPSDIHIIDEFKASYQKEKANIVFLCTPNNPLGDTLSLEDIHSFIEFCDKDTLIVIDGAYMEYVQGQEKSKYISPKDFIDKYDNVVCLRTFSKAYGLGGMRVGYGIANKDIIKNLYKIRAPFNISQLSYYCAIEALKDENHINMSIENNFNEMKRYEKSFNEMNLKYFSSLGNFITVFLKNIKSSDISNSLLKKGIIIRDLSAYKLNAVRITIGKKEQNIKVLNEIKIYINK